MHKISARLAFALLIVPMAAMSAPQAHGNHAGHATPPAETAAQKEFRALDKNKDGKLSRAELPARHPMAAHFAMMDANKDGVLSEAEYTAH